MTEKWSNSLRRMLEQRCNVVIFCNDTLTAHTRTNKCGALTNFYVVEVQKPAKTFLREWLHMRDQRDLVFYMSKGQLFCWASGGQETGRFGARKIFLRFEFGKESINFFALFIAH